MPRFDGALGEDVAFLWRAHTVSVFGSQLTVVAIPLLAIRQLGANGIDLSLLTAAALGPYLALGLFVGVWVDRLQKRRLLIAADLGRALVLVAIPLAVWVGFITFPLLLGLLLVHGTLTVIFDVTDVSYLPDITADNDLPRANARFALSQSLARTVGPAAGGVLVGLLSAAVAFLLDAVSYLGSAAFLMRIRRLPAKPTPVERPAWKESLTDGARTLFRDRILWALVTSTAITSCFGMAFQTLLVLFLTERLHAGPVEVGAILAAGGVGATAGAALSGWMANRFGVEGAILVAQALFGVSGLCFPLAALAPRGAAWLAALTLGIQLAFNTMREVNGGALSQMRIPDERLGRTQSTSLVGIKLFEIVGSLIAGAVSVAVGLTTTMAALQIGMALAIIPLFTFLRQGAELLPQPVDERVTFR